MITKHILSRSIATLAATVVAARMADAQFISLTGNGTYLQNFNTLPTVAGNWTNNGTLPAWYAQTDTGLTPIPLAIYNEGAAQANGLFSAGTGTERSLAWRPTSTNYSVTAMGVVLKNDSTSPMRIANLNYTGEAYFTQGNANAVDGFQFFYQVGNVAITNLGPFTSNNAGTYAANAATVDAGWTRIGALDFAAFSATAAAAVVPAFQAAVGVADTGVVLAPGQFVTFRWRNPNDTGGDATMGIDDLSISYTQIRNIIYNLAHGVGGAPNGTIEQTGLYWLDGANPTAFSGSDTLTFSQDGTATIDVPTTVNPTGVIVSNATGTYTIGGAGQINGSLTKSNGGTLVLPTANGFTSVAASGGTIATGNAASLGTASIALSGSGLTLQTNSDLDVTGIVSGGAGLTKTGAATLTLGGANTYTGATIVNSGTLKLVGSLALGNQITVNSGELVVNGIVNSGSTVTIAGAATLGGRGTVNGTTTISAGGILRPGEGAAGTLTLQSLIFNGSAVVDFTLGTRAIVANNNGLVANGATDSIPVNVSGAPAVGTTYTVIDYSGVIGGANGPSAFVLGTLPSRVTGVLTNNLATTAIEVQITGLDFPVWSGALSSAWTSAAQAAPKNWVLNSNASTTDFMTTDTVVFRDFGSNPVVSINDGDVTPSLVTFDNNTLNYVVNGASGITGASPLVKSGSGSVTINNTNSFTGTVTVNLGTISIAAVANSGAPSPLGAGSTIVIDGGALEFTGAAGTTNRPITVGANGGTLTTGTTLTLTGSISGTGVLTKAGTGRVVVTGSNTHSATVVQGGTLQVGAGGATGDLGTGPVTNNATLVFDYSVPVAVNNAIDGVGNVEKRGAGDVTFAGAVGNTYTGTTTVVAGTLYGAKTGGNSIGGDLIVNAGATFRYNADTAANQIADSASITVNGGTFGNPLAAPGAGSTDTVLNVTLNSGSFGSGRTTAALPFTVVGLFKATAGSLAVAQRGGSISAGGVELSSSTIDIDGGSTTAGQESRLTVGNGGLMMTDSQIMLNAPKGAFDATSVGSILVLGGDVTTTGTNAITRFNTNILAPKAEIDFQGANRTFNVTGSLSIGATTASVLITNGSLTKTGTGTLTAHGAQPFVGATTVNGGLFNFDGSLASATVVANAGGVFGGSGTAASAVTINNGGGVTPGIAGSGTLTVNSLTLGATAGDLATINVTRNATPAIVNITGLDGLTVNGGANSVTINVAGAAPAVGQHLLVDYAGAIQGAAGFSAFKLGTLPNRVIANLVDDTFGTAISLNVTSVDNPVWTGALNGVWTTASQASPKNWALASNAAETDFMNDDAAIFNDSATVLTVNLTDVDVAPSSARFENSAKDYTVAGTRAITGAGGIVKLGNGKVTVTNTNTYAGETRMNGGVLSVASLENSGVVGPLGAGATLAFDGGVLESTAITASTNRAVTLGAFGGSLRATGDVTLAGAISGAGELIKTGPGILTLTGANGGFNGGISIAAGTVRYSSATPATATIGGTSQLIELDGGTLEFTGTAQQALNDATVPRRLDTTSNGGTINVPNLAGAISIESPDSISGPGTITKTGPGTLRISGNQLSFFGNWIVNDGALEATTTNDAFGTGSVTVNGGVVVTRGNPAVTVPNAISLNGGALGTRSGDLGVYSGTVTVAANSLINLKSNTTPANATSLTVSGLLEGSARLDITGNVPLTNGNKSLILTNPANTYSGTFAVSQFQGLTSQPASTGNTLGTATISLTDGALNLRDDGIGNNGILAYGNNVNVLGAGATITVDRTATGLNTGNTFQLGALNIGTQTLTVTGANQYNVAFTGGTLTGTPTIAANSANVALAGSLSGAFGINKTGAAGLVIAGNHTFTGPVDVQAGTLAGTGTVAGAVAVSPGADVQPGILGIGVLGSGGDFVFGTGAAYDVEISHVSPGLPVAGTDYDQITVGTGGGLASTGAITLGNADLNVTVGTGVQLGDLFFIMLNDGTDSVNGTFNGLPDNSILFVGADSFRVSYDANSTLGTFDGGNDVALLAIPEPGSAAMLLGGLAMLAGSRRRRR